jgi:hypothetical protein
MLQRRYSLVSDEERHLHLTCKDQSYSLTADQTANTQINPFDIAYPGTLPVSSFNSESFGYPQGFIADIRSESRRAWVGPERFDSRAKFVRSETLLLPRFTRWLPNHSEV